MHICNVHMHIHELKSLTQASICILTFIEILFTIGKIWKQLRSPGEQINKKWNIHATEYCAIYNKKKF